MTFYKIVMRFADVLKETFFLLVQNVGLAYTISFKPVRFFLSAELFSQTKH